MTDATMWAVANLRRQRMPRNEIHAILSADDPVTVRRHLELHRERMEEWLEDQRRIVDSLEPVLTGGPSRPRR